MFSSILSLFLEITECISSDVVPVFAVSSAGPAGTDQDVKMGVYLNDTSQQHNNRPVYILDRGREFLFYDDNGYWVIGLTATVGGELSSISTLQTGLLTPPVTGWRYWDGGEWKEDPQLTVSGETITCLVSVSKCSE